MMLGSATPPAPTPISDTLSSVVLLLGVVIVVVLGLLVFDRFIRKRTKIRAKEPRFAYQIIMLGLTALAVVLVIVILPFGEQTRTQLLAIIGLVITAVITFSSTTFVSNAMAGLMLRSLKNFKPGDFLRVEQQFGRVTERGLFHTEIQTEGRDLATIPNLYLVTHPVTVVHASGTIVSAEVSLGYDVPRKRVQQLLLEAAQNAELTEPFVHVMDLGDHSVTYRVAGFLEDVKQLLSTRSRLRKRMLDALHDGGVEILSPNWMAQRPVDPQSKVLPPRRTPADADEADIAESVIFDKAERAEQREGAKSRHAELQAELDELKRSLASAQIDDQKMAIETRISKLQAEQTSLERDLEDLDLDDGKTSTSE